MSAVVSDLKERAFKTLSRVLKVPVETITEDSSPDQIPAWDSLRHMSLVVALEEEFGVQFETHQIGEMLNAGLVLAVLKEKLDGR